jgi:acyl-coenzyme A thioesterase 9
MLNKINKLNLNVKNLNLIKTSKYNFSQLFCPNSLVFKHKKELEKIQKQMTRMKTPALMEEINQVEEDFEPGINYFTNFSKSVLKVYPKSKNPSSTASPEQGFIQLVLPFDQDKNLRNAYRLLDYERIRFGKLLEILDYLTAMTTLRFNNILPRNKIATLATAGVDEIELFKNIDLNESLIINTYPTWTGESSIEVRVDLYNGKTVNNQETEESFLGSAFFTYVLRDAGDYSKKKKGVSLDLSNIHDEAESQKAKLRYEIGTESKKLRIQRSKASLFKSPPTQEESAALHEQFVTYKASKDIIISQTTKGLDSAHLSKLTPKSNTEVKTILDTKIEKNLLMHSQNININGHVFGGYIMREAMELGYVCAYMHSNKQNPQVVSVDSVAFHKPVVIGSVAQFRSQVTLVHEELLHVCVEVFNFVDSHASPVLTTTVNITYKTENRNARVFPTTYECGVKYLEAKRIIERLFNIF